MLKRSVFKVDDLLKIELQPKQEFVLQQMGGNSLDDLKYLEHEKSRTYLNELDQIIACVGIVALKEKGKACVWSFISKQ